MYRTIDTAFWTDPKVRAADPDTKLLMLYLVTNSHAHVGGIYHIADVTISHEIGYPIDRVSRSWIELDRVGFARRCSEKEVVWVVQMLRHQGNGIKIDRAVANQVKSLHNCSLINDFINHYPRLKKYFPNRVSIPHPVVGPSWPQEQEQEQELKDGGKPPPENMSASGTGQDELEDDPLDAEVHRFIGEHRFLTWDPRTHAKCRQLVGAVGWPQAKHLIDMAVASGTSFPVGYALGAAGNLAKRTGAAAAKEESATVEMARVLAECEEKYEREGRGRNRQAAGQAVPKPAAQR